ncbi:MAG: hypothetical protein QXV17_06835 [Candidatus Micrarchaeaceae archaeon]
MPKTENHGKKFFALEQKDNNEYISFIELNKTKLTTTKMRKNKKSIVVTTKIPIKQTPEKINKEKKWETIAVFGKIKIRRSITTNTVAIFYDDEFEQTIDTDDFTRFIRVVFMLGLAIGRKSKRFTVNGKKAVVVYKWLS